MAEGTFRKEIKLWDAIMLVAGTMIGSGIFMVTPDVARHLGGSGWIMLVWGLAGFITLAGALSYGELAGMMPHAGGQYVYLREAYGKLVAFLYGWTLFLVIQTGTIAAVGVAFATYTGYIFPSCSDDIPFITIGSFTISNAQIVAILCIWFLSAINMGGVKYGKWIQTIFGSTKIVALLILILCGLGLAFNADIWHLNWSNAWDSKESVMDGKKLTLVHTLSGSGIYIAIGMAMVGALFSSDAWNNVSFAGDEIVKPERTLPLSLGIGTALVTIIYLAVNAVYLSALPVSGSPEGTDALTRGIAFAQSNRIGVAASSEMFGAGFTTVMAVLIMVSTFGCNNGCILSGARVYYKMADDGLFFKPFAKLNKNGVPGLALGGQAFWASLLCLSGSYGNLLDYVMFAVVMFSILTIASIFKFRKTRPNAPRPYKAFGYPIVPFLYILLTLNFLGIILIYKSEYTLPGIGIVALGLPVYYLFRRRME